MKNIRKVKEKLEKSNRVAIFAHVNADGDALGSSLALKFTLKRMGKQAEIFIDSKFPENLNFLPEMSNVNSVPLENFDLYVAVDCCDEDRLGSYKEKFMEHQNTVCIDHHKGNNHFAKVTHVTTETSSTCEEIFGIIEHLDVQIDRDIAICLIAGILTDTGRFKFACTSSKTMKVVAKLMDYGRVQVGEVMQPLFESISHDKFEVNKFAINSMKFFDDNKLALIAIKKEDFIRLHADQTYTKDLSIYAMELESVKACVIISEDTESRNKGFFISFRSKGDIDVSHSANTFGGGGHKNAAGCKIYGQYEDVEEKVLKALRDVVD